MTHITISLDKKDKSWLDKKSAETGMPMSEIVRQTISGCRGKKKRPSTSR
ncbi:MAG: hypothetical protein DMG57_09820 [Acidobacteria bacterium]|nr:MAG: hypothetical protein DMG57_09820 [Acidobacteriota bacterium]